MWIQDVQTIQTQKQKCICYNFGHHVQYPVKYLSRLQRILPAVRWELYFMAAHAAHPSCIQGMHAAMDRAAPWARSQDQGMQEPRRRHIAMGTQPKPRHACCQGQGSPIGTQPRPRNAAAKAKACRHGHAAKAKAWMLPRPR